MIKRNKSAIYLNSKSFKICYRDPDCKIFRTLNEFLFSQNIKHTLKDIFSFKKLIKAL